VRNVAGGGGIPRVLASRIMTRREWAGVWVGVAAGVAMKVAAFFRYRFDSDEPQHLHVAWGWTQGFVQYRDFFDNHAPLFHIASAPFLMLVGERSDALLFMRALMLPLAAIVLGATFLLARRFWSTRIAIAGTLLLAFFPPFFLKSLEYRTDNAWTAMWMLALLAVCGGHAFIAGLLLGVAFCVSMKSVLFVIALVAAMAIASRDWRRIAMMLAGVPIAPALLALYFQRRGAWPQLVYCVVRFNEMVAQTHSVSPLRRAAYPFAIAALLWLSWRKRDADRWRLFLGVACGVFLITLGCFWTLISPRDWLPAMPLLAIFVAAVLERRPQFVAASCILSMISIAYYARGFENQTDEHITMMNQVLGMTRTSDPLMDYKGETIFRRRPFYNIFEKITREQVRDGLIADTIPESLIAARCHAAQADGEFWPPRARAFMNANYLDMGRIRASGQWLAHDGRFTIAVPGDYVVIDAHGIAAGTIDRAPQRTGRALDAGVHQFTSVHPERLAVMWAPAFARGYSPFHLRDREF
jgi:hypothetical protein